MVADMTREDTARSLVADLAAAMAARGGTIQNHTTTEVTTVSPQVLDVIRRMAEKIQTMEAEHQAEVEQLKERCARFDTQWQVLRRTWSRHSQIFTAGPPS